MLYSFTRLTWLNINDQIRTIKFFCKKIIKIKNVLVGIDKKKTCLYLHLNNQFRLNLSGWSWRADIFSSLVVYVYVFNFRYNSLFIEGVSSHQLIFNPTAEIYLISVKLLSLIIEMLYLSPLVKMNMFRGDWNSKCDSDVVV